MDYFTNLERKYSSGIWKSLLTSVWLIHIFCFLWIWLNCIVHHATTRLAYATKIVPMKSDKKDWFEEVLDSINDFYLFS